MQYLRFRIILIATNFKYCFWPVKYTLDGISELHKWLIYVKRIPFFPEDLENFCPLTLIFVLERSPKVVLFKSNVDKLHLWIAWYNRNEIEKDLYINWLLPKNL